MKTLVRVMLILCIVNAYSQKVKVKKDRLFIEKNEVGKLIDVDRNHYKVQDLEGKDLFSVQYEIETVNTLEGEEQFQFLKFNQPKDTVAYYTDYDLSNLKISFSGEKTLVRHLIQNNEFLSESGINFNNIDEFFSQPRPRSQTFEEKAALYQEAYKFVEEFNLKFDGNKILKAGVPEDTLVGSYSLEAIPNFNSTRIKVFDATGFLTATHELGNIKFFDGNIVKFSTSSNNDIDNAHSVVERMIIDGYTLGDMRTKKIKLRFKKKREEIQSEKLTSTNIYDAQATVYDDEGNAIDGELTLEFKELDSKKSGVSSLKNYGGVATLKTVKDNGKYKYTDYKAKDRVRICVEATGNCYQGITTKGMTAPKFNLEVEPSGKLKLYKSQAFNYYILYKEGADKGLIVSASALFKDDNSEAMLEDIYDYLSDCPSLKTNLNTSELNLKEESDLKSILQAYHTCR